jgi:hypothetical protein
MFLYIHAVFQYLTLFIWVHYYKYLHLTASFSCTLPELCVFCNYACIQHISFYVFLYIHAVVWHLTLFFWVHYYNYLLLTASFSCTLSYMQHKYYQRTPYQCMTSYAASLPTILGHPLNSGFELAIFVTNKWSLLLNHKRWTKTLILRVTAMECLSKTGISVETSLLLSQQCLLGTVLSLLTFCFNGNEVNNRPSVT